MKCFHSSLPFSPFPHPYQQTIGGREEPEEVAEIPESLPQLPLPFPWELSLTMTSESALEQDIPIILCLLCGSKTRAHSLPSPQREVSGYWPHSGLRLPTEHHHHMPSFPHIMSFPLSDTTIRRTGQRRRGSQSLPSCGSKREVC